MRLPRAVIAVSFFIAAVFLTFLSLRSSHLSRSATTTAPASGFNSFFSFRAPFSLFPPNAIITLTHENSTAFLARPAAFGPSLPQEGLNGRVWIGSGFGDDAIHHGTAAVDTVGELGCSDVPGWSSYAKLGAGKPGAVFGAGGRVPLSPKFDKRSNDERLYDSNADISDSSSRGKKGVLKPAVSDGTDDHLHQPLSGSGSGSNERKPVGSSENHADIQSIQESAEIAGRIVLLSRGGCGFLEKVLWAQRRGAIALIVGDDTKGGPLIQMYARGDTSNVTIPSIFTSRTTAHLLSSLVGPGNFLDDSVDEKGNPTLKVLHTDKPRKAGKKHALQSVSTTTTLAAKSTTTARPVAGQPKDKSTSREKSAGAAKDSPGWLKSMFFGSSQESSKSDSNQLSKSGKLDWVLVEDWKDADHTSNQKSSSVKSNKKHSTNAKDSNVDDFIIGVQDWRDPDLVGPPVDKIMKDGAQDKADSTTAKNKPQATNSVKKPGGEAQSPSEKISKPRIGGARVDSNLDQLSTKDKESPNGERSKGLFDRIFGDDDEDVALPATTSSSITDYAYMHGGSDETDGDGDDYDGLWVTLTPTSGASPFLDTILVLVVSPLITLTVVYALLLVRSRIRRRRWRAPKSVVERLPVRTYQTIQTSGNQSPRMPSPSSSSAATPLLQQSPAVRPRPRSRTTTGIPETEDLTRTGSTPLQVPSPAGGSQEHEKSSGISPEWKKYMGRQVECVVCLEEYVDGVSRVMSLPCGHEFHAECITPWLITRRRTCPICKGDVVRSLARGSPSSPRYEPYIDDSDDDIPIQASEFVNESSSSALPIPRSMPDEGDLESGLESPTPTPTRRRLVGQPSNWTALLPSSLRSLSRSPQPPQEDQDRDR
ncbi:hypothetical protein OIDMADRAFT_186690 [Oidiodendron maius Zn]|uniref:RING-type domain-containing protein n=1 Tax=Oidiodendron maius (strain Zn) TaxID=913774 RepID=A0A0C3HZZ9_OIDMZ|nr:hypothetical protein OIDMADRAFT_186690 [Oidiodendron maius Zn]